MASELELFGTITRWLEEGRSFALATVVKVSGSAPRHGGARMLTRGDGVTCGTVGGGALEQAVAAESAAALLAGEPRLLSYQLKTDLGMACGGSAQVYVEPILPPQRLYLFGGGHIGLALAPIAVQVGFVVTVIDERAEFVRPDRFPQAAGRLVQSYDPAHWEALAFDQRTFCVVATHGHGTDLTVVRALMAMQPGPRYVGMIGSKTKRRAVEQALQQDGVAPERIAELHTPMGLPVGAETPSEIAVSIAAELVQVLRHPSPPQPEQSSTSG